jgi:two-component system chemotaxis sensor kinase CheA
MRIGEHLLRAGEIEEHELEVALEQQAQGDQRKVGELLVEQEATTPEAVDAALKTQTEERSTAMETIRVDVRLLDDLMNLVGELVLARNQILQFTQSSGDAQFTATSQRLNLITTELQEGVMKTRMQPIENVWNKFPRVVRDLTLACGKQARLEMEGKHTEVDKTLLEAIKDPLTHLIRNAVDHGLELPSTRAAKGKSAEGVVSLRAFHEGGQVIIEIADDGAGIDANKIRQKAVQKGLMTAEEAAARPDREIINVIFAPGFSTAEQVSNISGRGVGMDVVKTNIEAIGGSVDVQTVLGRGTTFKVKIPLTLAIIPALLVTAGGGRYAIPQVSLLELVRLDNASGDGGIEWVQGAPVYRLRGRLLPLVFLNEVFRSDSRSDADVANIVVVQADDVTFGLVVDDISDTAEIVVKPLGRLLKNAAGFAGATIMGDGRVALILDLPGVAELAGVNAATGGRRADGSGSDLLRTDGQETILVVGIGDRRFALPLARVARLEEIPTGDVRWAGDQRVVHYREHILPLVAVGDRLGIPTTCHEAGMLQVLVCGTEEQAIGLIVDDIFDIVEERLEFTERTSMFGVRGTTILGDAVTDVLDLDVLVGDAVVLQLEVAA